MFWKNFERRVRAFGYLVNRAVTPGISTAEKSSYYRVASMLLCTLVEGLVYQLVKKHTNTSGNIIGKIDDHKRRHLFPTSVFGGTTEMYICEKIIKDVHIDDNGVTFDRMNTFLRDKKIVTKKEWEMLDKVRIERNKIHLQSLKFQDTGYTRARTIEMSKPVRFLVAKL